MSNIINIGGGAGGGTSVVPNPQGTATDTLTKLGIEGTIYDFAGGGSSGHNYSTTEQVVGTWIDGSTLYEKTIQFPSSIELTANAWTNLVDVSALSIDNLVSTMAQAPTSLTTMSPYAQIVNGMLQAFLPFKWYISLVIIRYTKSST